PSDRDLLRAAALVVAFDRDLLASAVPDSRDSTIQRFLLRHFVRSGRQGWLRHSLHEVIRSSVRTYDNVTPDCWSNEEWRKAAVRILEFLGTAILADTTAGEHSNREPL